MIIELQAVFKPGAFFVIKTTAIVLSVASKQLRSLLNIACGCYLHYSVSIDVLKVVKFLKNLSFLVILDTLVFERDLGFPVCVSIRSYLFRIQSTCLSLCIRLQSISWVVDEAARTEMSWLDPNRKTRCRLKVMFHTKFYEALNW